MNLTPKEEIDPYVEWGFKTEVYAIEKYPRFNLDRRYRGQEGD